ncbi:MAG: hypothetical protein PHP98_10220 [Kiritimatiellae bacterium]|nr:hypothetical protein [Kiritimatiellia bacterium]
MNKHGAVTTVICVLFAAAVCFADGEKTTRTESSAPALPAVAPVSAGKTFFPNAPGGSGKPAPFSAEISADFIRKVMETSARIEECKKQIAERKAYLFENNPQIKAYRREMIEMQLKINAILEEDRDLADLRLNRDMLLTTMPALPKAEQRMPFPVRKSE